MCLSCGPSGCQVACPMCAPSLFTKRWKGGSGRHPISGDGLACRSPFRVGVYSRCPPSQKLCCGSVGGTRSGRPRGQLPLLRYIDDGRWALGDSQNGWLALPFSAGQNSFINGFSEAGADRCSILLAFAPSQASQKAKTKRKEIFKRAEQYVKEYRDQVGG
jgi:hypothetical protein